jgi:DNA-binding PadR family transcriptional regulator
VEEKIVVAVTIQTSTEKTDARIVKKLREKAIKAFLDIYILSELQTKPTQSGYDLLESIRQRFGYLMSSGTVYSLLYSLERSGLIKGGWQQRRRTYTLTPKGVQTTQAIARNKEQIIQTLGEIFLSFKEDA